MTQNTYFLEVAVRDRQAELHKMASTRRNPQLFRRVRGTSFADRFFPGARVRSTAPCPC